MTSISRRFRGRAARRLLAASLVAPAIALTASCNGGDDPAGPPPGGATYDLLYEGYRFGPAEPLVLRLDGGEPTRVLAAGTVAFDPAPSPDGSRIAYTVVNDDETTDVWVANRDGSGARRLTTSAEDEGQAAWSPDGTKIAYQSFALQREPDIFVVNADGSSPTNLTPDSPPASFDDARPAWSPDGTRIAFRSNLGGNLDIWTMRADGSDKRRVTNTPDVDTEPAWSPDGTRIVFRRSSNATGTDLAIVPADGGTVTLLPMPDAQVTTSWSPDGRLIAFTTFPDQTSDPPQIYTMRPDGGEVTRRTIAAWNGGQHPSFIRRR